MTDKRLVIVGAGSTARHVYDMVKSYGLYEVAGFAVDDRYMPSGGEFMGERVYGLERLREEIQGDFQLFVAMYWDGLNSVRRSLYERLKHQGYEFVNVVSPRALVHGELRGDNILIGDGAVVRNDAVICSNVIVDDLSLIGSGSCVEAHSFVGEGAVICGGVHVGEQTFVGARALVIDDCRIGRKCLVGAGTVVRRNLEPFSRVKLRSECCDVEVMDEESIEEKLRFKKNVR